MTPQQCRDSFTKAARVLTAFRGSVRRLRADAIENHVNAHLNKLSKANEAIRRLPQSERDRIKGDIRRETVEVRQLAARVARFRASVVRSFVDEARVYINQARRNTERSFPSDVFNHVTADGLIALALLRAHIRPQLATASVAVLRDSYESALARGDAAGLAEAEIIEAIVASNRPLAADQTEMAAAKELREYVAAMMDQRVPKDLPDLDALQQEADQLHARADILKIAPLNPARDEKAASAFEQEEDQILSAGEKSQAEFAREVAGGATA